jgi:hypothetical protein
VAKREAAAEEAARQFCVELRRVRSYLEVEKGAAGCEKVEAREEE